MRAKLFLLSVLALALVALGQAPKSAWTPLAGSGGAFSALTGDVTSTNTGGATTVLQVNGGSIPTSGMLKANSSSQLVAATPGTDYAAANASTTVNGVSLSLGGTGTIPTAAIAVSAPSLDLICARGSDANVGLLTITGATNAAPVVFTVSVSPITTGYLAGQSFVVAGVTPSAYNGTYTIGSQTGTTITATNGTSPGQAYSSGGTVHMACNNSSDATSTTQFSSALSIPGGTFGTNTAVHLDALFEMLYSNSVTATAPAFFPSVTYNSTTITGPAVTFTGTPGVSGYSVPPQGIAGTMYLPFLLFSPAAGTIYGSSIYGSGAYFTGPVTVTTSSTANLTVGVIMPKQGIISGTYTSGGTITGSSSQTCTLSTFTSSTFTGATATVALTGTNTISSGTALTITNSGLAAYTTSTGATSATLGSGTATCSGTATIATTQGGAQGDGVRLLSVRAWQ
jgi:hypothetical protein